tara:strand:+ start:343 stop:2388 length:2046 start_codon:yes stop_codon:yes gene_type:complete
MANTILMKSRQADATGPGATALKVGELAVNTFDGRVYLGTDLSGSASRAAGGAATASTIVGAPVLDEDDMSSDSNKSLATQQSIKKYVDDEITANAGTGDITGVTLAGDSGSASDTSANVDITIAGGSGITTSATGTTVTIAGDNASTSAKGVAQFSSDNFAASSGTITIKDGGVANDELAGSIADSKLNAISTANKVALSALDIDGGTDIGAAIASGDLIIVDDGAGGTNRKSTVDRLATKFAGDGLTASSAVMAVNVDDSSIETNSDAIRVKASGITNAMLAGSIAISKLAANDVTIAADSGTSHAIDLGETLTVSGTSNEIETSISNNTLTIGLPNNVTIGGNLTVSGTTTTVDSTTVAIADSMLKLAKDQANDADALDFGIYGQYGDGTQKFAGIFRDVSATGNAFTFFDELQAEPGTTVNTSGTGYALAPIIAGEITGTLQTAAQGNITSLGTLTTLTVDNVRINGTTIGHTDDTDLMTLADGKVTVAGELQATTLDIGGTNIAATAAEINAACDASGRTAGSVDVSADHFLFADGGATGATKVESIADLATAMAGDGLSASSGAFAVGVDDSSIETNSDALRVKASGVTNAMLAGSIADSKLSQITTAGKVALSALEIDGATDIGAGLADADLFIVDDGANGTERKCAASRIPTYVAAATMTLTNTTISGGAYST